MKIYFPQWQGSGTGKNIEVGARTILNYLDDPDFREIPLSILPAGEEGEKKFDINNYEAIKEQLSRLHDYIEQKQPQSIKIIGGDCGLEIVPVSYLNKKNPNLGVIWFDAHADINQPCDSTSCNFHGMPLRTLLGEGAKEMDSLLFSTINASQIHYVGLRSIDEAEQEKIDSAGIYTPLTVCVDHLIKTLKNKKINSLYLHFDFDCLEPIEYNNTYYQVPNGLKINEAQSCIMAESKSRCSTGQSHFL